MKEPVHKPSLQPGAAVEKLKVALISVGAALFLTSAKAIVGTLTGSLALLSEAAHSGLDLFASLVTALSVRAADRPPDRTHHYGHGKVESLSALFESILLFATCLWILSEAIQRLLDPKAPPIVNVYSFSVILVAIAVDFYRYNALMRTARKHHSQALEADAIHFFSDILSSSLVLVGLIAVTLGYHWADAVAAMAVAIWVGILSARLGKKNLDVLLDRVPEGYLEDIHRLVLEADGVVTIDKLRLRRSGPTLFADLRIGMKDSLSFFEAHRTARELEKKLASRIPGLDAVVHMNPRAALDETLDLDVMHFIRIHGFQSHHVILHRSGDQFTAELHLEVDANQPIGQAHEQATHLEGQVMRRFPELKSVRIHIEEKGEIDPRETSLTDERPDLVKSINQICNNILGERRCHAVTLASRSGRIGATMHCLFPSDQSVSEVHRHTTILEEELRRSIPDLERVLIHAEPLRSKP